MAVEPLRRNVLRAVGIIVLAAATVLAAILLIGGASTPNEAARASSAPLSPFDVPDRSEPYAEPQTPPPERPAASQKVASLDALAEEVIDEIKPIQWYKPAFDGKPENFPPEDFVKAKRIIDRYYANFARITSLSFHETKQTKAVVDNEFTRMFIRDRKALDNSSLDVESRRSPLYFKMAGVLGDGAKIEEIVTPAGKISSGHVGRGESWIPAYLDGDAYSLDTVLLKYGHRVRENVSPDLIPPGLEEAVKRKVDARYDVVEQKFSDKTDMYWFNRETGMLDFIMSPKTNPGKDESQFDRAIAIEYDNIQGIHYPRREFYYGKDYQIAGEEIVTDLVINGAGVRQDQSTRGNSN